MPKFQVIAPTSSSIVPFGTTLDLDLIILDDGGMKDIDSQLTFEWHSTVTPPPGFKASHRKVGPADKTSKRRWKGYHVKDYGTHRIQCVVKYPLSTESYQLCFEVIDSKSLPADTKQSRFTGGRFFERISLVEQLARRISKKYSVDRGTQEKEAAEFDKHGPMLLQLSELMKGTKSTRIHEIQARLDLPSGSVVPLRLFCSMTGDRATLVDWTNPTNPNFRFKESQSGVDLDSSLNALLSKWLANASYPDGSISYTTMLPIGRSIAASSKSSVGRFDANSAENAAHPIDELDWYLDLAETASSPCSDYIDATLWKCQNSDLGFLTFELTKDLSSGGFATKSSIPLTEAIDLAFVLADVSDTDQWKFGSGLVLGSDSGTLRGKFWGRASKKEIKGIFSPPDLHARIESILKDYACPSWTRASRLLDLIAMKIKAGYIIPIHVAHPAVNTNLLDDLESPFETVTMTRPAKAKGSTNASKHATEVDWLPTTGRPILPPAIDYDDLGESRTYDFRILTFEEECAERKFPLSEHLGMRPTYRSGLGGAVEGIEIPEDVWLYIFRIDTTSSAKLVYHKKGKAKNLPLELGRDLVCFISHRELNGIVLDKYRENPEILKLRGMHITAGALRTTGLRFLSDLESVICRLVDTHHEALNSIGELGRSKRYRFAENLKLIRLFSPELKEGLGDHLPEYDKFIRSRDAHLGGLEEAVVVRKQALCQFKLMDRWKLIQNEVFHCGKKGEDPANECDSEYWEMNERIHFDTEFEYFSQWKNHSPVLDELTRGEKAFLVMPYLKAPSKLLTSGKTYGFFRALMISKLFDVDKSLNSHPKDASKLSQITWSDSNKRIEEYALKHFHESIDKVFAENPALRKHFIESNGKGTANLKVEAVTEKIAQTPLHGDDLPEPTERLVKYKLSAFTDDSGLGDLNDNPKYAFNSDKKGSGGLSTVSAESSTMKAYQRLVQIEAGAAALGAVFEITNLILNTYDFSEKKRTNAAKEKDAAGLFNDSISVAKSLTSLYSAIAKNSETLTNNKFWTPSIKTAGKVLGPIGAAAGMTKAVLSMIDSVKAGDTNKELSSGVDLFAATVSATFAICEAAVAFEIIQGTGMFVTVATGPVGLFIVFGIGIAALAIKEWLTFDAKDWAKECRSELYRIGADWDPMSKESSLLVKTLDQQLDTLLKLMIKPKIEPWTKSNTESHKEHYIAIDFKQPGVHTPESVYVIQDVRFYQTANDHSATRYLDGASRDAKIDILETKELEWLCDSTYIKKKGVLRLPLAPRSLTQNPSPDESPYISTISRYPIPQNTFCELRVQIDVFGDGRLIIPNQGVLVTGEVNILDN